MDKVDELEQRYGGGKKKRKSGKRKAKRGKQWYKENFNKRKLTVKKKRSTKPKQRCPITESTTFASLAAKLPFAKKPLLQLLNKKDLRNLVRY